MNAPSVSRRAFLAHSGGGAGLLALAGLLSEERPAAAAQAPQGGFHFAPRARRVIWLFMHGGPSHVDLFDPKPELAKYAGQPLPESFGMVMTRRAVAQNPLLGAVRPFHKHGESGLEISEFLPHIAGRADDLLVIRSLHGDSVNHPQSVYQMNTGAILMGRPSMGSWLAYGLGAENRDLPAFIVLPDPGGGVKGGPPAWGQGFLPATYQGVTMRPGRTPILNLHPAEQISPTRQRAILNLTQEFNREHLAERDGDDELSARIAAYELAFRMQASAPELVALEQESEATHKLYGLDQPETREFGSRCLLARRMIERGVRMVQVYSGDTNGWDAHNDVVENHSACCRSSDLPVAGLLADLKQRGMLDETLVIWCGEFGRMPMSEQGKGRDHNPWGYCAFLAGAGLKTGRAIGATDAVGLRAAETPIHVRDFHATLLHLLGLDHERLTYTHNGLEQRLTGPHEAHVVPEILA
jgi:hypothetical protein